jgi:chromosome segregation ATPase
VFFSGYRIHPHAVTTTATTTDLDNWLNGKVVWYLEVLANPRTRLNLVPNPLSTQTYVESNKKTETMNSSYYQNQINRIEKEIADLYKKIADESKKENDKNKQIDSVNKSINKSTSISSLQSKQRQMQGYQNDIYNCKKKIAEHQKKIAHKSFELAKKKQELRRSDETELKKQNKQQEDFQKSLQRKIDEQKIQLDTLINQNFSSKQISENIEIIE